MAKCVSDPLSPPNLALFASSDLRERLSVLPLSLHTSRLSRIVYYGLLP